MIYPGDNQGPKIYIFKGYALSFSVDALGDWSSGTIKFKVSESPADSANIDVAPTSETVGADRWGNEITTMTISVADTATSLNYTRGVYGLIDEDDDSLALWGEVEVITLPI